MSAQLEHKMIEKRRSRLMQIRNLTYELNGLLLAALLTDDERTAQQDLKWSLELSLHVARELSELTGDDKQAIADWLSAAPGRLTDQH